MKTLILLATLCVASAILPASDGTNMENDIDKLTIADENNDPAIQDEKNDSAIQDENNDPDIQHENNNPAVPEEKKDLDIQDENNDPAVPEEKNDPAVPEEKKDLDIRDENNDPDIPEENNDSDLIMTDEGELENEKRAARGSVLIGGCNFNNGYRKCPRISVYNWLEHHSSGCNDVSHYCRYLKSYGFCNRRSGFYTVMRRQCRRTCQICTDPCRDIAPVGRCALLKRWGFCRRNNPFYGGMRRQCKKTCRYCRPHKRYLKTKMRNASVRFYTYKTWLRRIPAVRNCRCNPRTGVCGKLNFCVSFRYALNNVRTNRLTNTLRIYSHSYNTYVLNRRRRYRYSFTRPRNIYIPNGRSGDRNKWKIMRANVRLECGSRFYFNVYTGPRQNQLVKFDDFYVRVGRC